MLAHEVPMAPVRKVVVRSIFLARLLSSEVGSARNFLYLGRAKSP